MIEINLAPKELRKKTPSFEFDRTIFLKFVFFLIPLFLTIHLLLGGVLLFKKIKLNNLNNTFPKISQELKEINGFKEEFKKLQTDNNKITELTKGKPSVALLLYRLSMSLPNGIWFRSLKFSDEEFLIDGSVVSLSSDEAAMLNKYLTALKNEEDIIIFSKLELQEAKKRNFQGIDILDFIIRSKLK